MTTPTTQSPRPVADLRYHHACVEAQFLMGHIPAGATLAPDGSVWSWSWPVDLVRQSLHVPCDALWSARVMELEMQGLASFCFYAAPVAHDEDGALHEIAGWQDRAREDLGEVHMSPPGVLRLAELYGRPVVRVHESPALVAHWTLVRTELAVRLSQPFDAERFAREWPERWATWQAQQAQW